MCLIGSAAMLAVCWLITFALPLEESPSAARQRLA
jgi:hypothetical protein